MARVLQENFSQVLGESRSVADERRRTKAGINVVHSMINVEPSKITGIIERSRGLKKVYDIKLPLQNMAFLKNNSGVLKFTAVADGDVYDINNFASHTKMGSVATKGFVDVIPCTDKNFGNILLLLDGDYIKKYDFSSVSVFSEHHKASFGSYEKNRLWTNKIDEPNLIWGSEPYNLAGYDTLNFAVYFQFGSGFEPVTAMSKIFIPAQDTTHIVVAKRNEIHAIAGSSGNPDDPDKFMPYEISIGDSGTPSPRGLIQSGQEIYILSESGIKLYSSIISDNGIIKPEDVSEPIRSLYKDTIYSQGLIDAFMLNAELEGKSGRVYAFVPICDFLKNNYSFCFDRTGGWFRRNFNLFDFTCCARDPVTNKIYLGTSLGGIYEFNPDGVYNFDGQGYDSFVDYGYVDFAAPSITKTATPNSYIEVEVSGQTGIELTTIKRNANGYVKPTKITVNASPVQGLYDSSRYDETVLDTNLSSKKKLDIKGSFERLGVQVSVTAPDVDFKIKDLHLEALPAGSN